MDDFQLKTPVAFLIFNRPDTTAKVFEAIRQARPSKLLVVADGPRADRPDDVEKCREARSIIDRVDWDCETVKNYSDKNLGCGKRVATGITWVFEQVEEAIILEDDTLPHPTFFQFCEILLNKYREDERIMMISGTNFLGGWKSNAQSYHFSYYGGIWGWASWKRAWQTYDYNMKLWNNPESRQWIRNILADDKQASSRNKIFEKVVKGEIDTWDYQWSFARLIQSGLSIVPSVNLISNIGFGQFSTHTSDTNNPIANLPVNAIKFPLKDSFHVVVDRDYDFQFYQKTDRVQSLLNRILQKLKRATFSKKE